MLRRDATAGGLWGKNHARISWESICQQDISNCPKNNVWINWVFILIVSKLRDAEMTIKIVFERSSQKGCRQRVQKEVNRGPTLKFYCRPKAQEKQLLGKSHFYCRRFFPRKYSDNNLGRLPPFHPPCGSDQGAVRIQELLSERILIISFGQNCITDRENWYSN